MPNKPDFDERALLRLPAEHGSEPDCFDVYMDCAYDRNREERKVDMNNLASLRFVFSGGEFSLVAIPHKSLLRIAEFITEYVNDHQE